MNRLVVNGVRLDSMLALPKGAVFDMLPPDQRGGHFLRAAHVGGLALNLMEGRRIVNPKPDLFMHVDVDDAGYPRVRQFAEDTTGLPIDSIQFTEEDWDRFTALTGQRPWAFPAIILGFPKDVYGDRLKDHPLTRIDCIAEAVPFGSVDPYSRQALENLFEMDLSHPQ